jgi:ABC-2 type transport system ATP-binding protein
MGSSLNALSVRNVAKHFGDVHALLDVSLTIARGEFFGLLGPNGAGKTTLLRIISGLLPCDAGDVQIAGDAAGNGSRKCALGIVPQEIALYESLTAEQNLHVFGAVQGMSRAHLKQRMDEVLNFVGLESHRRRRVKTYSGGMKRRLNLAVGLLHEPDILLLDEPTVGVDPQSRARTFELLEQLRAAGKTIIYTTHYMEEAERLCDRIGIIDHGLLLAEGTLSDLLKRVEQKHVVRVHGIASSQTILEFAAAASRRGHEYVEYIPNDAAQLGALVMQIEASPLAHSRLELIGPDLETLFLQLTGRELRDE